MSNFTSVNWHTEEYVPNSFTLNGAEYFVRRNEKGVVVDMVKYEGDTRAIKAIPKMCERVKDVIKTIYAIRPFSTNSTNTEA